MLCLPSPTYHSLVQLLETPTRWCQNFAALNHLGERTMPLAHNARQWCLIGGISKVYSDRGRRMDAKFQIAFYLRRNDMMIDKTAFPGALPSAVKIICQWQDHYTTTHTDVMEMLHALEL